MEEAAYIPPARISRNSRERPTAVFDAKCEVRD
jgi:hypothetical protein